MKRDDANRTSTKKKESTLLAALSAALSDDELQRTLVAALLALDHAGMVRLARRLGTETGGLVRRIVSTKPADGRRMKPAAGTAKIRQEWESAWAAWEDCVAESGDEDGKYVLQDHEWEAPYFDTAAVANDLERVAARIRRLLPRVIDECLCKPTFRFAEVLRETADAIGGGLPEWMDGSWEPAWFGREVTGCLLEAEWRMAQRAGTDAFEYVDAILAIDQSLDNAGLDDQAIVASSSTSRQRSDARSSRVSIALANPVCGNVSSGPRTAGGPAWHASSNVVGVPSANGGKPHPRLPEIGVNRSPPRWRST